MMRDNQTTPGHISEPSPLPPDAPSPLPEPAARAMAAYRTHVAQQGPALASGPVVAAWAPGRVNLIGEHTDYNLGLVLPAAVDRVVALAGQASATGVFTLYSLHHDETATFPADRANLLRPSAPDLPAWARYSRAVLAELAALADPDAGNAWALSGGFTAALAGDVPVGGGMSSSAALEVATATFAAALGAPRLPPMETAQLCQRAEERGSGVRVGIMDQAASCLGRAGHALLLDCRSLDFDYVAAELGQVALAVFDTGVPRTLAETGYNTRRAECEQAVALLAAVIHADAPERQVESLRDVTTSDLARYASTLPDPLLRRVRHVVSEHARVLAAVAALRAGDLAELGQLLYASHASLRDDYEVSCPELDATVELARATPGILGARLMGAGFGGSALILVRRDALPVLGTALARDYPARTGRTGTLHVCALAGGPAWRVEA